METIAEITISYSYNKKTDALTAITSAQSAAECLRSLWSTKLQHLEEVYMLLLDTAHQVLGFMKVSMGGVSSALVDPKVIFQAALKANASAFILAHNHPSGTAKPSKQDIKLTERIRDCAVLMDITLLDHMILTKDSYFSFAEDGLL